MKNKIINIPNLLTTIRLFLAFIFVYFINNSKVTEAIATILLAIFTDMLDGYLARRLKQESKYGRIFDSSVDTTFFLVVLLTLLFHDFMEPIIVILIIACGVITALSYMIQNKITPTYWSKAASTFVHILIIISLLQTAEYELLKWPVTGFATIIALLKLYTAIKSHRKL